MKPLPLIAGLLALSFHACTTAAAAVPVWNTTVPYRMTHNDYDDHAARFAGDVGVWSGFDGNDDEIYWRPLDGRPQRAITDNAFDDELPQISEYGVVVWQGYDGHDWEIFSSYGYSGVVQITDNETDDTNPQISMYLFHLAGRVVWQGYDGADLDIFSANADGSDIRIISDAAASGMPPPDDIRPQINVWGQVTWEGRVGGQWDIFAANADGTGRVNLSNSPAVDDDAPQIDAYSGQVVWQSQLSAMNSEIFSAPASGAGPVVRLTNDTRLDSAPQIGGGERVVWMTEVAPGNWDIHAADADGGNPEAVTDWPGAEQFPVIGLGAIVWQGFDGTDWEIYARLESGDYQLTDNAVDDRWPAVRTSQIPGGGCPCPEPSPGVIWQADSGPGTPPTSEIWVETWSYQAAVDDPPPGSITNQPHLEQLGGNPVRGSAEFRVALPVAADARVDVLDVAGRRLVTLRDGALPAGDSRILWDGRDATARPAGAGVYFVRLRSGTTRVTRKIVFVP